jgi:hypothetical protein
LGYEPTWLRAALVPGVEDAFAMAAGSGGRMSVYQGEPADAALSPVITVSAGTTGIGVSGESVVLYRFDQGPNGELVAQTDLLDLRSGLLEPGTTAALSDAAGEFRVLIDWGWDGIVWQEAGGVRVLSDRGSGASVMAPSGVVLQLAFVAPDADGFRLLRDSKSLLHTDAAGGGVLVELEVDEGGAVTGGGEVAFRTFQSDYDEVLLYRAEGGSVWLRVR